MRACAAGSRPPTRRAPTSRSRTCRSPFSDDAVRMSRSAAASPSATRSSTWRQRRRALSQGALAACLVPQARRGIRRACAHRRLHRLLRLGSPRDHGRHASFALTTRFCRTTSGCPSRITAVPPPSGCRGRSSPRPHGQTKSARAEFPSWSPTQRLDYRARGWYFHRQWQLRWASRFPSMRRRAARVRVVPLQRLVGARRTGVGIPASGAVSRQEFRYYAFAMDRHAGSAGAVPHTVDAPGR